MRKVLMMLFLACIVLTSTSFKQNEDCGCIPILSMTPQHLKCMNSAAAFYNCIRGTNIDPDDVESYGFYIYTGEGTKLNRVKGDKWNFTIQKHLMPNVKQFRIRGLQLKEKDGEAGAYLRREARVDFEKNEKELRKLREKAAKEEAKRQKEEEKENEEADEE